MTGQKKQALGTAELPVELRLAGYPQVTRNFADIEAGGYS